MQTFGLARPRAAGGAVKRTTIKDVARVAGVDVSTVSRAMRGNPRISDATRARVASAAAALDYRPNVAARAMVTSRTHTFAFLVPSLADPNVASFAAGAESEARQHGYSMAVAAYRPVDGAPRNDRLFREHRFDGVLLMSPRHYPDDTLELPLATLEEATVDNFRGGVLAGTLLAECGHRSVAFIGGEADSPHARERLRGLRSILGGGVGEYYGDWSAGSGFERTEDALRAMPNLTAVFAASDTVALGVLGALHGRGRSIPGDVSVIGFDDIPAARHYWPRLSTIAQPLERVGATAFQRLLGRIEGEEPTAPAPLPVRLVERDSVGPARGARR